MKQFNNSNNGLLIVFEGIDGSGKTTQIELLKKYLQDKNIPFEVISFPQYGKNEYANKISDYLSGKYGEIVDVDPYEMAKLYAADRQTVRDEILGWLKEGRLVIANRYVSSNKAHQGANLPRKEREKFFKWIDKLEYGEGGMPKPDLTILLNVDPKVGQQNAIKDHKVDIHEKSIEHEQKANKIYLELSQKEENWIVVECMEKGQMKAPEDTHKEIIKQIDKRESLTR